jgi:hypothetical protein
MTDMLLFVVFEKSLQEVWFLRIKERVAERRSTADFFYTNNYVTSKLQKRPPNIPTILSIKNSSILLMLAVQNFSLELQERWTGITKYFLKMI